PAHVLDGGFGIPSDAHGTGQDKEAELAALGEALEKTRIQTLYLEKRVAEHLTPDDAAIFHTHLMILEDRSFLEKIRSLIDQGQRAFHAVQKVMAYYMEAFENMEDPYLRERGADIKDIGRRLLANLTGHEPQVLGPATEGILIAHELFPSDMAALDHHKTRGIAVERAGENAHAIIMAKSLGRPTLVGVKGLRRAVTAGDHLILDGNSGFLYINPRAEIGEEYQRLEDERKEELERYDKLAPLPALSRDGVQVTLRANIGLISDVEVALRNGARGIGLYRTEFPYMIRDHFPDRNDQYLLYRRVVESFKDEPVTIRTLDIGGDKGLPYFTPPREENPFMGWRSVRFSLDNQDIFRTQIEAILMAACHGPVKLLFPMISSMDEAAACKAVVRVALENLDGEGIPHASQLPLGVMIEVPAAIQLAGHLAREFDFFALGTNDLIQYMLASDRNNPLVRKYYDPLHPSILQVIRQVSDIAVSESKGLCLCGEMVTDPLNFLVLFGMGIREFSMAAPSIPRVKEFLGTLSTDMATGAADAVLQMTDRRRIRT
ncbi:MAG: phosphoenolpyruvate--protein phosphotransferase, partial [bacterium]|nr:phosphoenolpyruvate--protein phosphotransferase [bacterium]